MSRLLAVGPLPPPLTGTPVSFDIFCEQAKNSPAVRSLLIVDSSPKYLKQSGAVKISLKNVKQSILIVVNFARHIKKADNTIIFGSNGFVISLAPILLSIAKVNGKQCFFRVFGGSLDQYISSLSPLKKWLALATLRNFSGVIVQTKLLKNYFEASLKDSSVYYVSGYRQTPIQLVEDVTKSDSSGLKIVFVGIVKREKGIFVLLEAMRKLAKKGVDAELVIYGSIHTAAKNEFERTVQDLANTKYAGILSWTKVIETLSQRDLLVLPTFYESEGHPGVLIEAMMAGITVISTNFRSIPEIVTHDYNGLLVSPMSVSELVAAIEQLALDRDQLSRLAHNNYAMSHNFTADRLVEKLLAITNS